MTMARLFFLVGSLTGFLFAATAAGAADAGRTKNASGPGCAWVAKRAMLALLRDDIVAANDYQEMYRSFVCSAVRLADAFGCVVAGGAPESAAEVREKIDVCWEDPRDVTGKAATGTPKAADTERKPAAPEKQPPAAAKPPAASPKAAPVAPKAPTVRMPRGTPPYIKQ